MDAPGFERIVATARQHVERYGFEVSAVAFLGSTMAELQALRGELAWNIRQNLERIEQRLASLEGLVDALHSAVEVQTMEMQQLQNR